MHVRYLYLQIKKYYFGLSQLYIYFSDPHITSPTFSKSKVIVSVYLYTCRKKRLILFSAVKGFPLGQFFFCHPFPQNIFLFTTFNLFSPIYFHFLKDTKLHRRYLLQYGIQGVAKKSKYHVFIIYKNLQYKIIYEIIAFLNSSPYLKISGITTFFKSPRSAPVTNFWHLT